jgi:hypothetical protein
VLHNTESMNTWTYHFKNVTLWVKIYRIIFPQEQRDIMIWGHREWERLMSLCGKISKNDLQPIQKHEINRKFVCFVCKIKLYFTHEHQLLYFHLWLCHSRNITSGVHSVKYIIQSYMQNKQISIMHKQEVKDVLKQNKINILFFTSCKKRSLNQCLISMKYSLWLTVVYL